MCYFLSVLPHTPTSPHLVCFASLLLRFVRAEEPLQENIDTCVKYFKRMAKVDLLLEMELGITGGVSNCNDLRVLLQFCLCLCVCT
jgi:hypothetical protein